MITAENVARAAELLDARQKAVTAHERLMFRTQGTNVEISFKHYAEYSRHDTELHSLLVARDELRALLLGRIDKCDTALEQLSVDTSKLPRNAKERSK